MMMRQEGLRIVLAILANRPHVLNDKNDAPPKSVVTESSFLHMKPRAPKLSTKIGLDRRLF